jgi:hypothetical protein
MSFLFSTEPNEPSNQAWAWGYPDSTPHDNSGLIVCPVGNGPMLSRTEAVQPPDTANIAKELWRNPDLANKLTRDVEDRRALELAQLFDQFPASFEEVGTILKTLKERS